MGAESDENDLLFGTEEEAEVDLPAVGVVATATNGEQVARCILRAREHGHEVLVTHQGNPHVEAVEFAHHLSVNVIDPETPDPSTRHLRSVLGNAAQAIGASGVLYNGTADGRIDFQRSIDAAEADEVVDAIVVDPEMPSSPDVLVGIPAYNEAGTIADVVASARSVADAVLVVDDGSDDETADLAREAGAIVVEHERNSGYGATLKTIFEASARRLPEHLVIIDADGQHDPTDIPDLVGRQRESEAEVVIGSRFVDGASTDAPLYRRFGLHVVNALTNLSLGVVRRESRISDTQSGFRAYDRRAIRTFAAGDSIGDHMSASTDILYQAHHHGFDIEEVGTEITYDVEDTSTRNPISHGITLVSNILKTVEQDRPITVLGIPGFISTMLGIAFGYWTFSNYIGSGTFPLGLAVVSAFFGLAGIFASFTAIILHSLNTQLPE